MNVIDVQQLTYDYGRVTALRDVNLTVPEGALYALLGPNGSGKTTLLQCLMGLRRPQRGRAMVLGVDATELTPSIRTRIGYVAEGQALPGAMKLRDVESYLAPLYDGRWDPALANTLRDRFDLDPSRRIRALSRGEQMKAALLCALAPRPELLIMDEPFTGMDALVKNELVGGLLESASSDGSSILLCSHDIGELELLADHVGFLQKGDLKLSETTDSMRDRFKHVEVTCTSSDMMRTDRAPSEWLSFEFAGNRMTFVLANGAAPNAVPSDSISSINQQVISRIDGVLHVEIRSATLREVFIALAQQSRSQDMPTTTPEMAA